MSPRLRIALAVFVGVVGCLVANASSFVPAGNTYRIQLGRLGLGIDSFNASVYWWDHWVFNGWSSILGAAMTLPAAMYVAKQVLRRRRETARGFPVD